MLELKRLILGWLWRLDELLPLCVAVWTKNRCWPWRPVLDVVEVHLSDTESSRLSLFLHARVDKVGELLEAKYTWNAVVGAMKHGHEQILNPCEHVPCDNLGRVHR